MTAIQPCRFEIRRSESRGHLREDWLDARFSFSFGTYHHPQRHRLGPLLALNEDRVQPLRGFPMHPHRNLEILMIPLKGEIEHRDSLGHHARVGSGDVQFMRAGRGIRHSQMNPSVDTVDHHLQIWLEPRTRDLEPLVDQRRLPTVASSSWTCIASAEGEGGLFAIDADVRVEHAALAAGAGFLDSVQPGRWQYFHVIGGEVLISPGHNRRVTLRGGDALVVMGFPDGLQLDGMAPLTRILKFDVAPPDETKTR